MNFKPQNLLALGLMLVQLLSSSSSFAETAYDENSETNALVEIGSLTDEPMLSSTNADPSRARLVAIINKSSIGSSAQTMKVYFDGRLVHEWLVSTGREKLETAKSGRIYRTTTPVGYFRPTRVVLNHYSQTWKADMPHAVFFNGGIAVHASTHVEQLGKRASGGCVRLAPENAKIFYDLVKAAGIKSVPNINRSGVTLTDATGNTSNVQSWDVLIIVENRI